MFFCDSADDSMAIMMAFSCPQVEVVGLTTVFGNAATEDATRNALLLVCGFFFFFLLETILILIWMMMDIIDSGKFCVFFYCLWNMFLIVFLICKKDSVRLQAVKIFLLQREALSH